MNKIQILIVLILFLFSCKNSISEKGDPQKLAAISNNAIQMVVEIPAGTNHKIEINKETGEFENDQVDGKDRIIDFLPYPGNYGFIPSTLMEENRGGDGDALDVLMIGESLPTGTVVSIQLIGTLLLKDKGEIDTKLIAIPADSSKMVLKANDFAQFSVKYAPAKKMIEDWFLNYKGAGVMEFIGWRDERHALNEVKKWRVLKD